MTRTRPPALPAVAAPLAAAVALAGCGVGTVEGQLPGSAPSASPSSSPSPEPSPTAAVDPTLLPGMPPPLQPDDVYAATSDGFAPAVQGFPELIYVPNGASGTVTVVDPRTKAVVATFPAGKVPQHVVPSYDLTTLWVNSSGSNTLTKMDPATGSVIESIPVDDPYTLYFSCGRRSTPPAWGSTTPTSPATGAPSSRAASSAASLLEVDTVAREITRTLDLPRGSKPQDVKLSPDGSVYFIAGLNRDGLVVLDAATFTVTGFIPTGAGAHGLYTSRDSRDLYVSNREEGTVSVLDLASRTVRATYRLPAGTSPNMGNLSGDGTTLWLSSRYGEHIYAMDMRTGETTATVRVGKGPHGLTVYPQPGRYSLGHTGILR